MPSMSASTAASGWRPSKVELAALLEPLGLACREAGEAIRAVRRRGFEVEQKGDLSPVTEADRAAEAMLLAALAIHAPGIPVVAEEEVAAGRMPDVGKAFFLVDPLDGTREFVRGGDDYTVNIGLVDRPGRRSLASCLPPSRDACGSASLAVRRGSRRRRESGGALNVRAPGSTG